VTVPGERPAVRAAIERFVATHPGSVLWDGERLLDVFSGRTLALDLAAVARAEERTDKDSGRLYLALLRDDGSELALADAGIAFPPVTASSGPLEGLPRAVCLRDLSGAEGRLTHFLLDHPGEPAERAHVAQFLFCLAVVDGARAVGFEVSSEERRLEAILGELEARKRG
jgi:hypothetical protein